MIRFSEIIHDGKSLKGKGTKEGIDLRKTGIWNKGKVAGKNTMDDAEVYYRSLLTLAGKVQSWVKNDEIIDISQVVSVFKAIIDNELIDSLYYYVVFEGDHRKEELSQSIDVTIFSLKVGLGMGYDSERLLALGMIAFLHDVGMYKIPQNILEKTGKLSEEEFKLIQKHPEIGAEILHKMDKEYDWLGDLALQVHERADGSGYPKGLKEKDIHYYAFIIGLVDMYSAMIKDRPYRDRIEKNRAMRSIIASSKGKFPPQIVKTFLNQISFFPVRSYVKLNDHSVGRVITTNPSFPLKPTVEIINDNLGNKLDEPRIIDLTEQPLLYITGSIDEKNII